MTWRTARTERFDLRAPTDQDLSIIYNLYSDERVWRHAPHGRHDCPQRSQALIEEWRHEWHAADLGQWLVTERGSAKVLGNVGCAIRGQGDWWSLSYRLFPEAQGRGVATEAAAFATDAAREVAPRRPIIASLLEHNAASRALVERLGLTLVQRGPDQRNRALGGTRLIFSDRPVSAALIERIANR